MIPPEAQRIPVTKVRHGHHDTDDYAWMRDRDDPALRDYLAAERAYYDASAARWADLTDRLAEESASRIPAGDSSVDWPLGGFVYRTRTPPGAENPQFLRSRPGEAAEQLLLDENVIGGGGYVEVADRLPSPDASLLAWSADLTGAEIYQLRIRDLADGTDRPDLIERGYPGLAWSADSRYLFYLVPDELNRPFQVWRHEVGLSAAADTLLYTESDARYDLTLQGSRSGQFAVITSASRDTTEVRLIPLADPLAEPRVLRRRHPGVEYHADHARSGTFYVVTDEENPEFSLQISTLGPTMPEQAGVACTAVAPARSDTRLHSCDVVGDRLLLTLRRGGAPLLAITDLDGGNVIEVPASGPAR